MTIVHNQILRVLYNEGHNNIRLKISPSFHLLKYYYLPVYYPCIAQDNNKSYQCICFYISILCFSCFANIIYKLIFTIKW